MPVQLDAKRTSTVAQWLTDAYTDGFIVLHDGAIVYERYLNGQTPSSPHLMFSVTKSFTGTLALMLMEEGKLDANRTIASYVPELAGTAFADATVQQLLNMTNSIEFDETYDDPKSDITRFAAAFSSCDGSVYSYLQTLKKPNAQFAHGEAFHYVTPDPEVLGWIIRRVTGKNLAQVLEEKIWSKLGTDQDGYYWVDSEGTEMAGGGFNIALRDGARFGQMILDDGKFNGQQIVSAAIARRIKQPGDHEVFGRFYKDAVVPVRRLRVSRPVVDVQQFTQGRQRARHSRPVHLHRSGRADGHRQTDVRSRRGQPAQRRRRADRHARDRAST